LQIITAKIKLKIFNIWQICVFIAEKQDVTDEQKLPFLGIFCTKILTFGIF